MRVIIDTNVVLDVLLARKPFVAASAQIFALVEKSKISGFLCATTITTIDYLLTQSLPKKEAQKALGRLLRLFEVALVNRAVLEGALDRQASDFEDAVIAEAALLAGCEVIVTRNVPDFRGFRLTVVAPDEFLAQFSSGIKG